MVKYQGLVQQVSVHLCCIVDVALLRGEFGNRLRIGGGRPLTSITTHHVDYMRVVPVCPLLDVSY
jgi:hypothetical protein